MDEKGWGVQGNEVAIKDVQNAQESGISHMG